MNVVSVRLQRYGQRNTKDKAHEKTKGEGQKHAAKVAKACKEQKRATAQRCKRTKNEHADEYTYLYTLKQCTHEKYITYIHAIMYA